ncbi:obscurin-like isoform X1 [Misgurnus anguillicaudatus]|uniref:obscurin-like isoform X1 n=1 Tax=Misgurnus anguillicaudatus TaxID=75329 RepID=UPI003CCF27A9
MSRGCCCVLLLALVAAVSGVVVDVKKKVGDEVRFKPDIPAGSSFKDRSIIWKYTAGGDVIKVIEWDNDFKTLESLNPKFSTRVALDKTTGELTIRHLKLEDTGLYTIEIYNKEQEKKFTLTVMDVDIKAVVGGEVRFKPDIPAGSSLNDITWKYTAGGDVIRVIEWDNDFKTLESNNPKFSTRVTLDKTTGELTIRDLKLEHTGLYTIEIYNKEQEKKFTLTVVDVDVKTVVGGVAHFKPDIPEGSLKDSSITWKYTGGGEVIKVIEWDNDFKTLESLDPKFKTRVALDKTTGELTIRDLQLEHTGLYTIEINNKEQEKKFTLTVMGVDIKAVVGGEVRFKPDIPEGSLKDSSVTWIYKTATDMIKVIEWDNDFQTLECMNPKFKTRVDLDKITGELTIRDLKLEDTGLYTIKINNKEQEKKFTLTVMDVDIKAVVGGEVHFKPDIPAATSLKDTTITWKYTGGGDVMNVIEWDNDFQSLDILNPKFKNRVALDRTTGELTIRHLKLEHTGLYTIKINNKEQEKKFTLTVMETTST